MITVSQATAEFEEKKSKFITYVYPISSEEEARDYIQLIKKEHYKARHHCSAYRYLDAEGRLIEHSSDDGEPSGTAGRPMLDLLRHEELLDVLVIVVRYFGGIKLGTGGLVRAYSNATKEGLQVSQYIEIKEKVILNLVLDYPLYDSLIYYLDQNHIDYDSPVYLDKIEIPIYIDKNDVEKVEHEIVQQFHSKIKIINKGIKEVKIPIH